MSSKKFILLVVALLAALAVAYFVVLPTPEAPQPEGEIEQSEQVAEEAGTDASATAASGFDLETALEPRIMGDTSAPIKISEHSSFTCPHCAHFHTTSLPAVKEQLIDTGKAYIVFSDFPLNAPALHASMIARCLPQSADYFGFVQTLFVEQDSWAQERNYLDILKDKAAGYGLDDAGFKACLENEDLQKGIVAGAKAAQTQWEVSSTPSFVVNNKTLISGAGTPEEFISRVNQAAAETTGDAAPAAATEEAAPAEEPAAEVEAESEATPEPEAAPAAEVEDADAADDDAPVRWGAEEE